MPSEPKPDPAITDEKYEVEIVDAPSPADSETDAIEKEGDPIGDNFA